MKFISAVLTSMPETTMRVFLFGALCASMGASNAFAATSSDVPCPAGFSCFLSEPRDGACPHPAIVLDEQAKSDRLESDPYSRAFEKSCIPKTGTLAARRGGELRLTLGNGAVKLYKDNQKACEKGPYDSCKTYMLYDYFPDNRLLLVHVTYYESDEWLLVRQQDGKEENIVSPPRYSPGKKWLASVFWTEGPSDGNNGIDIVPANGASTEPAFHYRSEGYELWEYVRWEGDDRLSVKVSWRPKPDSDLVDWPAEVVRINGQWQLRRWAPGSPRP